MVTDIRIGVVGCGHWGGNHVRVFDTLKTSHVTAVCDVDEEIRASLSERFPDKRIFSDHREMLESGVCDAVVVATIASTHREIAGDALERGIPVLAEKPLTLTVEDADELVALAEKRNTVLMTGHTFLFNPAVRAVKQYLDDGRAGEIYYLKARRTHLGLIREDVNVVWDLAPHDVSMLMYFLDAMPDQVQALGGNFLRETREDAAFINLGFPGGQIASITVSWADSNKERYLDIVGSRARIAFDDLDHLEPVRIFEKGVAITDSSDDFGQFQYLLRDGDILSPKIKHGEPLKLMCQHFLDSVRDGRVGLSDGKFGRDVVSVLTRIGAALAAPSNKAGVI